jgi:hypothetical protein
VQSTRSYAKYSLNLQVQPIVDSVRDRGDAAVSEWTAKFDKVELGGTVCCPIEVPPPPPPLSCPPPPLLSPHTHPFSSAAATKKLSDSPISEF